MILAIESATPVASVALVRGASVEGEALLPGGRQVSESFLGQIDRLLALRGTGPARIDRVAVSAGPGSFTGLRVGMAAAKGFCVGWSVPLVPVPTLHALAFRFPREGGTAVCPVLDARRGEVYAAAFRWEGGECLRVTGDAALPLSGLPGILPAGPVLFLGDGAGRYREPLRERFGERARFPDGDPYPRASAVGLLAGRLERAGGGADPRHAVPAYLRPSEAERNRPSN